MARKKHTPTEMQAHLGHSDTRTTLDPDYRPEIGKDGEPSHKPLLRVGEEVEPGSVH